MQGKEMERPKLEKQWERSIQRETKKRAARAKKLEALGYEFNAPELKSVTEAKAIAGQEEPKAIEAPPPAAEPEAEAAPAKEAVEESSVEKAEATPAKKPTRGRGRPAKTPQKAAATTETPRKTRRTKA